MPLELVPDAIVAINRAGTVLAANTRADAMFGYEPGGLLGERLELLVASVQRDSHADRVREFLADPRPRAIATAMLRARRRDGREFPAEISLGMIQTDAGEVAVAVVRDVTEAREAAAALRAQTATLDAVLEYAPSATALSGPDGRLQRVNRALCELLGFAPQELLGRSLLEFTHPDDRARSAAVAQRALAGELLGAELTKRYVRADGATVWARAKLATILDARGVPQVVVIQLQDVTAERALTAARARLAAVVESMYDAVITATLTQTITTWNAAAERIYGYSAQEAVGQNAAMIAPGDDAREHQRAVLARIAAGEPVAPFETLRRRKDGTLVHMSVTASPLRDEHGRGRRDLDGLA